MPERLFHNTEDSPHAWFHIPCKTARTYSLKFSSPGAVITACCAKLSVFLVKLRYHSAPGGSAITAPNNHDTGGYAYLQKTVWYRLRIPGLHARDTFCSRQLLLSAPFHYILHWYQNRGPSHTAGTAGSGKPSWTVYILYPEGLLDKKNMEPGVWGSMHCAGWLLSCRLLCLISSPEKDIPKAGTGIVCTASSDMQPAIAAIILSIAFSSCSFSVNNNIFSKFIVFLFLITIKRNNRFSGGCSSLICLLVLSQFRFFC